MDDARSPDPAAEWRRLLLYGKSTATYKPALAQVLQVLARRDTPDASLDDLAELFLDAYIDRLQHGYPQWNGRDPSAMENIVESLGTGTLSREAAIDRTRREGFRYVLDAFHRLRDDPVGVYFFRRETDRLTLTDEAMALLAGEEADDLAAETDARWGLLESAFAMNRSLGRLRLVCDERALYLAGEPERDAPRTIATVSSTLHGYQDGRCLYCGEPIGAAAGSHGFATGATGGIWDLVLAHDECAAAAARTPAPALDRLARRNERLVASHHPLGDLVRRDLGGTSGARARALRERLALPTAPGRGRGPVSGWA